MICIPYFEACSSSTNHDRLLYNTTSLDFCVGIFFSSSSDTNYDSLMKNTTYAGPTRLIYPSQVVQTQTTAAYVAEYYLYIQDPTFYNFVIKGS
jgi:hypothetical protein